MFGLLLALLAVAEGSGFCGVGLVPGWGFWIWGLAGWGAGGCWGWEMFPVLRFGGGATGHCERSRCTLLVAVSVGAAVRFDALGDVLEAVRQRHDAEFGDRGRRG